MVIVSNGLVGVWALLAHRFEALRVVALWWCTGVAQVTIAVEVVLGVVLSSGRDLVAAEFHEFYGFVALIAVALIFSYRHQVAEHRYLLYGGGSLFLMGLGIRAALLA